MPRGLAPGPAAPWVRPRSGARLGPNCPVVLSPAGLTQPSGAALNPSCLIPETFRPSSRKRSGTLRLRRLLYPFGHSSPTPGSFEANFEPLDLAEFAKKQPWWRKLFGQESGPSVEKYSVATQLLIGGVTGWCTGFIFQKVGKLAATAVGGGFFLLQLANHTGYIKVDWQRVEKDMKKAKEQLKIRKSNQISTEMRSKAEEVVSFVKKNVLVTGGFFGGFLLGMAS